MSRAPALLLAAVAVGPLLVLSQQQVDVSVFYESLCPDSVAFITKQLYPTWKLLGDYMNVKFVPFGKSSRNSQGLLECHHGPRECEGNLIHSCGLALAKPGSVQQVEFVSCLMSSNNPVTAAPGCSGRAGISWPIAADCTQSELGMQLQRQAELETIMVTQGPKFVPTIVINNVLNERNQKESLNNLLGVVCRHLAPPLPPSCGV